MLRFSMQHQKWNILNRSDQKSLHFLLFTRKQNNGCCIRQVFWLNFSFRTFPFSGSKQWLELETVLCPGQSKFYSYGDSAGITPDFPFNPFAGDQIQRKCRRPNLRFKIGLRTGLSTGLTADFKN
jgi:hypothetical protein